MKKITCLLYILSVLVSFLTPNVTATETLKIYGEAFSGNSEDLITIPVYVENNTGFFCYNIDLVYDSTYLTPVLNSERRGNITKSQLVVNPDYGYTESVVKFVAVSSSNLTSDGMLFSYQFKVNQVSSSNIDTLVQIRVNELISLNSYLEEENVEFTTQNCPVLLNQTEGLPRSVKPDQIAKAKHFVPDKYAPISLNNQVIDKPYFISFGRVLEYNGYTVKEYGMIFSDNYGQLRKGEKNCYTVPATKGKNKNGQFGILFYGSKMKKGTTYFTRSYVTYIKQTTGEEITIYGEISSVVSAAE